MPVFPPFFSIGFGENDNIESENKQGISTASKSSISNHDLSQAIESVEAFDRHFIHITKSAIETFRECGRVRTVWMLMDDVASLFLQV